MNLLVYSSSIVLVILYALVWFFVFFKHRKACAGTFGSGGFILLTYLLYAVTSVILYMSDPGQFGEMHLLQFAYLFALLYIGLIPVLRYDRTEVTAILPPSEVVIKVFSIVYIISTLLYIPSAITHTSDGLAILLTDSSGGADLYNDRLNAGHVEDYSLSNIFSIFYNIFKNCAILVYFYFLTIPKGKKLILLIFSFAVFSSIFISLASGNRTEVTFSILTICASYLLFRKFYNQKIKIIARVVAISLGSFVVFLFLILTISRFGELNDGGADSMLYYIGHAPLIFNEYAFNAGGIRYGDRTINLFKKYLGFDVPSGIFDTRMKYQHMAIGDEIFTTYIGDFVLDFGPWLTPLLVILFTIAMLKISKCQNGTLAFYKLIPIHYVMTVCVNGGMYLFCYPFLNNLTILAYIFFYFCCKYLYVNLRK